MRLEELLEPGTEPVVLGSGYGFSEGPAADSQGNVYFSDGKNDSIHFYEIGLPVRLFVNDSTDANGMIFSPQGELLVCEGAAGRIVAFDIRTRQKRVLASEFEGLRFNEPNDLAVDAGGGVYFSDPNYQHRGQPTVRKEDAYYLSPQGVVSRVSIICQKPNGVLLSADGKTLYLADSLGKVLYQYDVLGPGRLGGETLWLDLGAKPDGLTLDTLGNLYICCGAAGVHVYGPDRAKIGVLALDYASNCVFGGREFRTLFVTSRDRFLGIPMTVAGIRPRRPG